MAHRVARHVVTVGDRQAHYLRVGEGPAVLLVHESPMTGRMLQPLAEALAELGLTAIALDTPGYGLSDPLPDDPPSIERYADALVEVADALGLERPHIYGSHTGAMIALEVGFRHRRRIGSVVADGLPAFTREEAVDLGRNWLVTYPPRRDGAHLVALWHRYRDHTMFFPWYRLRGSERLEIDLPGPASLHDRLVDWLHAGVDYTPSYHAAFAYEGHLRLHALRARTALTAHDRDLLGFSLDRLPSRLGRATVKARMPRAEHARWIARFLQEDASPPAPPAPPTAAVAGRWTYAYLEDGSRRLLARRRADGDGRPLVLLPEAPDTGSGLEELVTRLGRGRPVVALDLPGTGGSDPLRAREPTLEEYAGSVDRALRTLGAPEIEVYGRGAGAVVALELALRRQRGIHRVLLDGLPDADLARRVAAHPRVDCAPETDGSHLIRVWTALRDRELFRPWFDRTIQARLGRDVPPPGELHRRTFEALKALPTWDLPERAAMRYPADERRALLGDRAVPVSGPSAEEVAALLART